MPVDMTAIFLPVISGEPRLEALLAPSNTIGVIITEDDTTIRVSLLYLAPSLAESRAG